MRRAVALVLLVIFLAVSSCGRSSAQSNPEESLDAYLTRTYSAMPGVAVAVLNQGEIVFEKGYGIADKETGARADAHTRFLLASVTKQITAMAVMMLKEAGRFSYETPVVDFFPEFSGFAKGATIRHLLQHTAGFPPYDEICGTGPVTNANVVRFLATRNRMSFTGARGAACRTTLIQRGFSRRLRR